MQEEIAYLQSHISNGSMGSSRIDMYVQGKPSGEVSQQVGKRALNDQSQNGATRNITLRVGGRGSQGCRWFKTNHQDHRQCRLKQDPVQAVRKQNRNRSRVNPFGGGKSTRVDKSECNRQYAKNNERC